MQKGEIDAKAHWYCVEARLHQLYTNPCEQRRTNTNAARCKYPILQVFLNKGKRLRHYGSDFARRRGRGSNPLGSTQKCADLQVKRKGSVEARELIRA